MVHIKSRKKIANILRPHIRERQILKILPSRLIEKGGRKMQSAEWVVNIFFFFEHELNNHHNTAWTNRLLEEEKVGLAMNV